MLSLLPYLSVHQNGAGSAVWNWLVDILSDEDKLRTKLLEYQTQQDEINAPIYRELEIIDDLLADKQARRKRDCDMYEEGIINFSEVKEKTDAIDREISDLERREAILQGKLSNQLTPEVIEDLLLFAARLRQYLHEMSDVPFDDLRKRQWFFEEKRWFIERLNVEVKLIVEDKEQVAYVSCYVGGDRLSLASKTT